jgi:hypothetical protein
MDCSRSACFCWDSAKAFSAFLALFSAELAAFSAETLAVLALSQASLAAFSLLPELICEREP